MQLTADLNRLNKKNADIAGGKGASLGEMVQAGIPVPKGFVILSSAFEDFVKSNSLEDKIKIILRDINFNNTDSIDKSSQNIQSLIIKSQSPEYLREQIFKTYAELSLDNVAIRSSAIAEDSLSASWAGELESYLNIPEKDLLNSVKKCWASLFTSRAIAYAKEKGFDQYNSVAVVVQQMISPEVSGVCFTQNPVTKNGNQIVIEAGYGLGEAIVAGLITPDRYLVNKSDLFIEEVNIGLQKIIVTQSDTGTRKTNLEKEKQFKQKLNGKQIIDLSLLCMKIERLNGFPQDIEWALVADKFYILQSRPITTNL